MPVTPPVRPARPPDATRLRSLQRQLDEPSPPLLAAALNELSADAARSTPRAWRLLVSPDASDEPVGYLLAANGRETHIAELVVDAAHRRQHRATALLAVVCGSASQPVTVCVAAENSAARSLYEAFGFSETNRSTDQFDAGTGITLRYEPATT